VLAQLAAALRERGHMVDERVGQSRFRCDLGVRSADGRTYSVGIIVDTAGYYENPNVAERCVTRPGILRAFGWRVAIVLTRDWYHEPQAVVEHLERVICGEGEAPVEIEGDAYPPDPAQEPLSEPSASREEASSPSANEGVKQPVRRLELIEGRTAKYWEISQADCSVTIRFGRVGAQGQTQVKTFEDAGRAAREIEKLTEEKLRKGYLERDAESAS